MSLELIPGQSNPEVLVQGYADSFEYARSDETIMADPVAKPLIDQLTNHLDHISYRFSVARDSADFPFAVQRSDAYPAVWTETTSQRAEMVLNLFAEMKVHGAMIPELTPEDGARARAEQDATMQAILADPMKAQDEFDRRRAEHGRNALFPEFGQTLTALGSDMLHKPEVAEACAKSPILSCLRDEALSTIALTLNEDKFGYASTLPVIEEAVAFFDLVVRVNDPEAPPTYHSKNFEYNWYNLAEDETVTAFPTMASVTAFDLLKLRGVPIGLIGVFTKTMTVDGFPQTPYEFFMHDVDHSRRMHQESHAAIEREGVTPRFYAQQATDLLMDKLLPTIDLKGIVDEDERDLRIAKRMVLFEILHEDGYDPTADTIADGILRPPMERTAFEKKVSDTEIEYYMGPRATVLAHVYRKLAHNFYDQPDARSKSLGSNFVRTRQSIVQAATELYRLVSDDPIDDQALFNTCANLVSTDEGFTDGFLGNLQHDIRRRAVGRSMLGLMVSRPLGVAAAVREVRKGGKQIHSLFGYSALDYQDPEALEAAITSDLQAFDPDKTEIAIGATPYGIGNMYPAIKKLGFTTLGIVASKALGLNEECAEGVDRIVVVKDNEWGGYRYSQQTSGLLSPTTRVFVGASDSIAAYGGGTITAVTIEEALRRNKPVSYREFKMDANMAYMLQGQHGDSSEIDLRGPAFAKWQELQSV